MNRIIHWTSDVKSTSAGIGRYLEDTFLPNYLSFLHIAIHDSFDIAGHREFSIWSILWAYSHELYTYTLIETHPSHFPRPVTSPCHLS